MGLGGARDELFYAVELHGERALLTVSAFHEPPLTVCEEAPGQSSRSAFTSHFQHLQQLIHGTHQVVGQSADAGLKLG